MSTNGSNVAEPLSPSGALFINPAGLAGFPQTTISGSIGVGFGHEQVKSPGGYDKHNDIIALIPDQAISVARPNGWHFGAGIYGSVGMNYDFPADPAAGVDHLFFSECSIAGFPLAVAKRVNERLWLGAELIPLLGYMRNRFHAGPTAFSYKLIGPGIQAMVGATWKPTDNWSVGVGLRPPGRLWLDGSDSAPAGGRQDVDIEIEMPALVTVGIERQLTRRLRISSAVRWTDTSKFADSTFEFEALPQMRPAFVPDASDEWRGSLGLRFAWSERVELRAGGGYSNRIVGSSGVSPMVFDDNHYAIGGGVGVKLTDKWTLDFMTGVVPTEDRNVHADEAMALPGNYETSGFVFIAGVQRRY